MVTSAKSSVPTVTDQAAAMQLGQCAKNLATCLAELRTSAQKVGTINGNRVEEEVWTFLLLLTFDCLPSFNRLMKPVAPWRSTPPSRQSRP